MKTLYILLAVFMTTMSYADLSIKEMANMVSKIKEKRVSIAKDDNTTFKSPFVLLEKDLNTSIVTIRKSKLADIQFKFGGIVNNSAFVNKRWIKVGENISGYQLMEIKSNSVILKRGEENAFEVPSKKRNQLLHVSEEE